MLANYAKNSDSITLQFYYSLKKDGVITKIISFDVESEVICYKADSVYFISDDTVCANVSKICSINTLASGVYSMTLKLSNGKKNLVVSESYNFPNDYNKYCFKIDDSQITDFVNATGTLQLSTIVVPVTGISDESELKSLKYVWIVPVSTVVIGIVAVIV